MSKSKQQFSRVSSPEPTLQHLKFIMLQINLFLVLFCGENLCVFLIRFRALPFGWINPSFVGLFISIFEGIQR